MAWLKTGSSTSQGLLTRADSDEGFLVDVSTRELRDEARNRSHPLASGNSTEPSRREEP
jgi:hypothetical protein